MATCKLTNWILRDQWPGVADGKLGFPTRSPSCGTGGKGWDNTYDNFCSADDTARALNAAPLTGASRIPIGQKRQAYHDSTRSPGYYTMMYLVYHAYEGRQETTPVEISKDFSDGKFWCAPLKAGKTCMSTSAWADTSTAPFFVVGRCTTGSCVTEGAPVAVPCSTYAESDGTRCAAQGYGEGYGWFWVGGVCPCKDITLLDDETGAGNGVEITCDVAVGPVMFEITGDQPLPMECDVSDLIDATALVGHDAGGKVVAWTCHSSA